MRRPGRVAKREESNPSSIILPLIRPNGGFLNTKGLFGAIYRSAPAIASLVYTGLGLVGWFAI